MTNWTGIGWSSAVAVDEVVADGVGRALTEDGAARVAGDEPGQHEHDEHDPEQDRDRDEEPADDELDHGWWSSSPVRRRVVAGGCDGRRPRWRRSCGDASGRFADTDGAGVAGGSAARVEEPAQQAGPVVERAGAALVQRVLRVPLDRVADDDVVGVERRAVVERDAVTQRAGPGRESAFGRAFGRQRRHRVGRRSRSRTATR